MSVGSCSWSTCNASSATNERRHAHPNQQTSETHQRCEYRATVSRFPTPQDLGLPKHCDTYCDRAMRLSVKPWERSLRERQTSSKGERTSYLLDFHARRCLWHWLARRTRRRSGLKRKAAARPIAPSTATGVAARPIAKAARSKVKPKSSEERFHPCPHVVELLVQLAEGIGQRLTVGQCAVLVVVVRVVLLDDLFLRTIMQQNR